MKDKDDMITKREYVRGTTERDGVTVIHKVVERECRFCRWYPFGVWIGNWILIVGGTLVTILITRYVL